MPDGIGEVQIIFAEELRRSVRRRAYLIITLAVPALLLLLLVAIPIVRNLAEGPPEDVKPAGLLSLSPQVVFPSDPLPGFLVVHDQATAITALIEEELGEIFVVPEDYVESGRVEWLHVGERTFAGFESGPDAGRAAAVRALLQSSLAGDNLPPELLGRAIVPAIFLQTRIGPDGLPVVEDPDAEFARLFVTFIAATALIALIAIGSSSLAVTVAEEKENRMIEVLLTSAKPLSVMAGKVLAVGLAALIQLVVWVASFALLVPRMFDFFSEAPRLSVDPVLLLWALAFFLAGFFLSAVIIAGIGAASTGVREASQIAGIIIFPLIAPIYATPLIISDPDGLASRLLSFFPFTATTTMMIRMGTGEPPVMEIMTSLLVIVLTGIALLWASARVFRAGLLLYGQRMGLRRVWSALREAG